MHELQQYFELFKTFSGNYFDKVLVLILLRKETVYMSTEEAEYIPRTAKSLYSGSSYERRKICGLFANSVENVCDVKKHNKIRISIRLAHLICELPKVSNLSVIIIIDENHSRWKHLKHVKSKLNNIYLILTD